MKQTLEEAVNEIGGVHPDWREYITNNANPLRVLETIREDSSRGGLDFSIEDLLIDIAIALS